MNYKQQLLTKEWLKKRLIILKRDNYSCKNCDKKTNLHVHHKKYINGRMCWDYPNNLLVTLCSECHESVHKSTKIKIVKDRFKKKAPKPIRETQKQLRLKKLYPNMYNYYFNLKNKRNNS